MATVKSEINLAFKAHASTRFYTNMSTQKKKREKKPTNMQLRSKTKNKCLPASFRSCLLLIATRV